MRRSSCALAGLLTVAVAALLMYWVTLADLDIAGDVAATGARVFIDGRLAGRMHGNTDSDGSHLVLRVRKGHHTMEVSKPGHRTIRRRLHIDGEAYENVDLGLWQGLHIAGDLGAAGAAVFIDGRQVGIMSMAEGGSYLFVRVRTDSRVMVVAKHGYRSVSRDLAPGFEEYQRIRMERLPARPGDHGAR